MIKAEESVFVICDVANVKEEPLDPFGEQQLKGTHYASRCILSVLLRCAFATKANAIKMPDQHNHE